MVTFKIVECHLSARVPKYHKLNMYVRPWMAKCNQLTPLPFKGLSAYIRLHLSRWDHWDVHIAVCVCQSKSVRFCNKLAVPRSKTTRHGQFRSFWSESDPVKLIADCDPSLTLVQFCERLKTVQLYRSYETASPRQCRLKAMQT